MSLDVPNGAIDEHSPRKLFECSTEGLNQMNFNELTVFFTETHRQISKAVYDTQTMEVYSAASSDLEPLEFPKHNLSSLRCCIVNSIRQSNLHDARELSPATRISM